MRSLLLFLILKSGLCFYFIGFCLALALLWLVLIWIISILRFWHSSLVLNPVIHHWDSLFWIRLCSWVLVPWTLMLALLLGRCLDWNRVWDLRPWLLGFWDYPVLCALVLPTLALALEFLPELGQFLKSQVKEPYLRMLYFFHLRLLDLPGYFWVWFWLHKIQALIDHIYTLPDDYLWSPDPRYADQSWFQKQGWKLWRPWYRWHFIALIFPRKLIYTNRWPLVLVMALTDLIYHWGKLSWTPALLMIMILCQSLGLVFQEGLFRQKLAEQICARDYLYGNFPSLPKAYLNQIPLFRSLAWPETTIWGLSAGPGQLGLECTVPNPLFRDNPRLAQLSMVPDIQPSTIPEPGYAWNRGWLEGKKDFQLRHQVRWMHSLGHGSKLPDTKTLALALGSLRRFTLPEALIFHSTCDHNFPKYWAMNEKFHGSNPSSFAELKQFLDLANVTIANLRGPQDAIDAFGFMAINHMSKNQGAAISLPGPGSAVYQRFKPVRGSQAYPDILIQSKNHYCYVDIKNPQISNQLGHQGHLTLPLPEINLYQHLNDYQTSIWLRGDLGQKNKQLIHDLVDLLKNNVTDHKSYQDIWYYALDRGLWLGIQPPDLGRAEKLLSLDYTPKGQKAIRESWHNLQDFGTELKILLDANSGVYQQLRNQPDFLQFQSWDAFLASKAQSQASGVIALAQQGLDAYNQIL